IHAAAPSTSHTLSLHDALPILDQDLGRGQELSAQDQVDARHAHKAQAQEKGGVHQVGAGHHQVARDEGDDAENDEADQVQAHWETAVLSEPGCPTAGRVTTLSSGTVLPLASVPT